MPKFYAVKTAQTTGVYTSWDIVAPLVNGVSNAHYKRFDNQADANNYLTQLNQPPAGLFNHPQSNTPNYQGVNFTPEITAYTDGGCRNHGNHKGDKVHSDDKAAYAYTYDGKIGPVEVSEATFGATNNRMETMALLELLNDLKQNGQTATKILVIMDSKYVLNAINKGWLDDWAANQWRNSTNKAIKNQDLWQAIYQLLVQFEQIKFEWTKGHAKNTGNNTVDRLLNEAMDALN